MTVNDAEQYTPEQLSDFLATYPEHERDVRLRGVPTFGSGLVYPVRDETLAVEPFAIPAHFYRINGLDFG